MSNHNPSQTVLCWWLYQPEAQHAPAHEYQKQTFTSKPDRWILINSNFKDKLMNWPQPTGGGHHSLVGRHFGFACYIGRKRLILRWLIQSKTSNPPFQVICFLWRQMIQNTCCCSDWMVTRQIAYPLVFIAARWIVTEYFILASSKRCPSRFTNIIVLLNAAYGGYALVSPFFFPATGAAGSSDEHLLSDTTL